MADLGLIDTVMERLRTMPPSTLGGRAVEQVDDLALGIGGLPPTEGVRYWLADNARVIVRPSGTEPKIKCYLEVVIEAADGDVDAARALATGHLEAIKADLGAAAGL